MKNEPQLSAEMEKRFDEVFTNRLLAVTDGKSKDWEDGYNTMVESTRLFMIESKHFLATALEEQRKEILSEVDEAITKRVLPAPLYGNYKEDRLHQRWQVELNQLKGNHE